MEVSDLYERLKDDLDRFSRSIARNEQEAYDLVQEAVLKSLHDKTLLALPMYKQKAWFFRVMKNQLIDARRKEKRLTDWDDDYDPPVAALASSQLEMTELLAHLPIDLNDIVFKRFWLGMTSQEIGKQQQIPASTVRYKLRMALQILRTKLEEE